MAMAARSPAPPPPTISTSCEAANSPSLTAELLVDEHLSLVVYDHQVHAPVVELLLGAAAAAGVVHALGDEALQVLDHGTFASVALPAGCERILETSDRRSHRHLLWRRAFGVILPDHSPHRTRPLSEAPVRRTTPTGPLHTRTIASREHAPQPAHTRT